MSLSALSEPDQHMTLLARLRHGKAALQSTLQGPRKKDDPARETPATGQPDAVAALISTANRHFQAGDLSTASDLYKRILDLDPGVGRAYYMLSGIAAQEGDLSSAIGLAQRAIGLQPAVPEFHFSLASVYLSQGDMRSALRPFSCSRRAWRTVIFSPASTATLPLSASTRLLTAL